MISSDVHPPPDPFSSSDHLNQQKFHVSKISCDDKAHHVSVSDIDLLKSMIADLSDTNNPQPSFSIRDYVFDSRSKDIVCNWPFSQKSLKVCRKHGVKNLLPPFQSLEILRKNNSSNEETISSSCDDGKSNIELLESKTSKKSQSNIKEDSGQTKSNKVVIDSSRKTETAIKTCRVVGVETMKEASLMATKVCPVCKTFSSSSNTTLNAHIDRCLAGESSMKWTTNRKVVVKHRIKPRKMRLMVDIYKHAPHCTVEELDARNGTSWANNSSFSTQELKFHGEKVFRETTVVPEVPDHEGDVYIDNDGTKVRILSVPKVDTPDDHGVRTTLKGGKSIKSFITKKNNKNHELKHQHSKRLKPSSEAARNGREENVAIKESCDKEDRGKVAMNNDDLPIFRPPWACSKRSVLVKKSQRASSSSANTTGVLSQQISQKTATFSTYKEHFAKKRSPLLTEPNFKKLRKIGTFSRKNCADPLDLKSTGSKLSSSVEPVSKSKSKLNLKRKISAIKRSCVGPSEDYVVDDEISGKIADESTILLEVSKNDETTTICRPENVDSSVWMKTDFVTPSLGVESYTKETRSLVEPFSTEFPKMASHEPIQLTESFHDRDIKMASEKLQGSSSMASLSRLHSSDDRDSMSDSPISTISNPILARSNSDKFTPIITSGDWRSMMTTSFKNDHLCCCSRKDIASSLHESTLLNKLSIEPPFNFRPRMSESVKPVIKFPTYSECDSVSSPSKPVLRLMGKNLTVVNTDDYENVPNVVSPMGQFHNVVPNEYKISSTGQNGFVSQHLTAPPPFNAKNHALNTISRIDESPENGLNHTTPFGYQSQRSLAYNNDSFQGYSGFMNLENNRNLARWNCTPTSSSRSSSIYYPPI